MMKNIVTMTFEELLLALEEHSNLISNETKIGHNTNVRVGMLGKKVAEILRKQGDTGEKYLSKIDDDTAQGIITFLKAILIGDFSPGLLGSGGAIRNINGTTVAEFDQLLIRQRAEFFSALIHQAKHIGGELVQSAAEMICIKVEETTDFYRCYFDADDGKVVNLFENTDFARHQVFTGSKQKFYWRKVVAVGPDYIELSKTNAAINSDIPEVGDYIYQLGSENTERQGAIILSTVGSDAPSIKQYVNINTYALSSENEYTVFSRMGNKIQGKTVFRSNGLNYDDWADGTSQDIQDAQEAANAAALAAQQAIDDAAANVTDYNAKFAEMQAQVDGEISNYSYPYTPTLLNYPASDWATDIEKDRHIGDVFHNSQAFVDNETTPDSGKAWRFVKNGTAYSWTPIADSDAVKAIQEASKAQAMADGKSTTFLITPTKYKLGDMWVLNADQTVNGTAYKSGEILTATQDSETYNQVHWVKRVRYTDDTKANQVASSLTNFTETVFPQEKNQLQSQIDGKIETHFTASDPATAWTTADLKTKHTGDMWFNSTTKKLNRYSGSAWVLIEDQKAIDAFNTASTAKDTADGKRRVFTATPTVPYDVGDLWAQGTGGDLMRCITAKTSAQTYSVADWEKASKYTDDTAVENLQIGSRNFWLNSERIENIHAVLSFSSRNLIGLVEDGAEMTIQFDIDVPVGYDFRIYKSNTSTVVWGTSSLTQVFAKTLTVGKQTVKATFNFDSTRPYIVLYKNDATYRLANVTNLMLGLGNKVTWSEAPEDTQARINSAKQEALNAANNVQTNVDNLNTYVTGAFKDGLIDEAEAKAIEKYKNSINESMSKAEASFAKVFANTYLEGAAKTALENAKINLWGQRDTLLTTINNAIADGKTTVAEKSAVDSAFNTFNNLMSAFQSALEEANKATQDKLNSLSQGYVNDLQIGGRNYFNKNKTVVGYPDGAAIIPSLTINSNYGFQITGTAGTTNTRARITDVINEQGWWTVSCEVQGNFGNLPFSINIAGMPKKNFTTGLATEWRKVEITSNVTNSENYVEFGDISFIVFKVRRLKIEKGSKVTSFTEDPDEIKMVAEQAQLQAEGFMRARYVRDWTKGNTSNNLNQWSEIKIFNKAGINIALGKIPETNGVWNPTRPASNITDNNIDSNGATNETTPIVEHYAKIDLGSIIYDIDSIQVWHPYADGRTYYGTKTEISEDDINWTTIFDSAIEGTYKETAEGKIHSQRWASVISKLNQSKAITDKFGTSVNGGLITTVMMLLREANSIINTAGFSGIQGALLDQPSYWSGGTHIQAQAFVPFVKKLENEQSTTLAEYNNLPSIVFLHNGAAKIGHFIVLTSGEILIIDKNTGAIKLKFSTSDLPAIADLIAGTNSSGSTPIGAGVATNSSSQVVSGSTQITKNGATATFNGTYISISATGKVQTNGMESFAEAVLYARKDGVRLQRLATSIVDFHSEVYEEKYNEWVPIPYSFITDAGTYTFELVVHTEGLVSSATAVTSSTNFSWKYTVAGVKQQQYAKDGMMFFYSNRHFYFNELTGLDVKESDSKKFNLPGVLLSATVASLGGWASVWGAKQSTVAPYKNSTGRYTIYHTLGHSNYQVYASSHSASRSYNIVSKGPTSFIIEWRTNGSTPALSDTTFDFQMVGNNYS